MTIAIGDRLPSAVFPIKSEDGIEEYSTDQIFGGKRVVLVGMPGAFTPTCDGNHLPGLVENCAEILARGVDVIAVVAVNDPHVLLAWAKASNAADQITFLADVHGNFTKAIGMLFDAPSPLLGWRSKRYAAIVDDGVVTAFQPEKERGVSVSSAAAILEQLSAKGTA